MPVEFIGMIGTKNESEIRLTAGPVIDADYTADQDASVIES